MEQGAETHICKNKIHEAKVKRVLQVQGQPGLLSISWDSLSYKVQPLLQKIAISSNGKTAPSGKVVAAPMPGSAFKSQNLDQKHNKGTNKQTRYCSALKSQTLEKEKQVNP